MVSSVCSMYGWTYDYVLKMPARAFFALKEAGEKLEKKKYAGIFLELCDIAAIPLCDGKYVTELKDIYGNRFIGSNIPRGPVLDPADPNSAIKLNSLFTGGGLNG